MSTKRKPNKRPLTQDEIDELMQRSDWSDLSDGDDSDDGCPSDSYKSTIVEADKDEIENDEDITSASYSKIEAVLTVDDSINSPKERKFLWKKQKEAEPAEAPEDMESKSEAIAFSLSDISLPQSPSKFHDKSESKVASSNMERSFRKRSSSRKSKSDEHYKTNGAPSNDQISSSDTQKPPCDDSEACVSKQSNQRTEIGDQAEDNSTGSASEERKPDVQNTADSSIDSSMDLCDDRQKNKNVLPEEPKSGNVADTSEIKEMECDAEASTNNDACGKGNQKTESVSSGCAEKKSNDEQEMDVSESRVSLGEKNIQEPASDEQAAEKTKNNSDSETAKVVERPKSPSPNANEHDKVPLETRRSKKPLKSSRSSSSSSSSSSSRSSSPERRSYRKRKDKDVKRSFSRHSSSDQSMSDSTSDSDRRQSKRGKVERKELPNKKSASKGKVAERFEQKTEPVEEPVKQPKRPKINRTSFINFKTEEKPIPSVDKQTPKTISSPSEVVSTAVSKDHHKLEDVKIKTEEPPAEVHQEMEPIKISYRKLKMPFKRNSEKKDQDPEKSSEKRRRWRSTTCVLSKAPMNISSDSLKSIIPDLKLVCTTPTVNDAEEAIAKSVKIENETEMVKVEVEDDSQIAGPSVTNPLHECQSRKVVRKTTNELSEEPMETEKGEDPSIIEPALKPISRIVFIQNLVRPFTLMQLRDLLNQTGIVVENGFWIDKIKSKCFAKYENEEQAIKTREALHGTRWPPSNPKILSVDFASQGEFDAHESPPELPKPPLPVLARLSQKQEDHHEVSDFRKRKERSERRSRERDYSRQPVREWDKDKLSQDTPDRETHEVVKESDRSQTSERKKDRKESKKKQVIEDTPAKLLDDLFQKTKTIPSIYWLPFTEEQVKQREEERRQRRLDREKRNQQREQEEADWRAKRRPHEKENRSRSRSHTGRRR